MKRIATSILVGTALIAGLAGCSAQNEQQTDAKYAGIEAELGFTERDMDASYDESTATVIALSGDTATVQGEGAQVESGTISITVEGTYIIRGTLGNGTIDVNLPDNDATAQLVLDGASIRNDAGPALQVSRGDVVYLTLAEGSANALSDGTAYAAEADEDDSRAAIYTASNLTINGTGMLEVNGSAYHAISSQGDLVITGGTIDITSAEDGVFANGAIKIGGGETTVDAGDDGFHSEYLLYVADGVVDVENSAEGYEAERIYVRGGTSTIVASDDGVNASQAEAEKEADESSATSKPEDGMGEPPARPEGDKGEPPSDMPHTPEGKEPGDSNGDGRTPPAREQGMQAPAKPGDGKSDIPSIDDAYLIQIDGGTLAVDAGGDGLDSNGYIIINGGTVLVSGASDADDSGLDYEYGATVNGGDVIIVGAAGMAEDFTDGTQAHLMERMGGNAGNTVEALDANGNVLASYVVPKAFQAVTVSAPGIASINVR